MAAEDIKKINDEINKLRAELNRSPLKPFDIAELEKAKALLSGLQAEVREMGSDLDYISKSFKDSVNELSKQNTYLSDSRKALNGISNIAKQVLDYRRGETSLDEKTLQNYQKKASAQFRELERIRDARILGKENQRELESALKEQDLFNRALDETILAQKKVNKEIGLLGTGIEGISKGLSKMGFGNLSQPLTEAIEKTKNARLQTELNKQAQSEINTLLEFQNKGYNKLSFQDKKLYSQLKLRYGADKDANKQKIKDLESQNAELSTQTSKYKNIGKALTDQLTKANLIDFVIQQMIAALIKADTQTGQLAKAFGTSYSEAASMRNELNTVANLSGDINITTGALQESLIAVNKEFGTAVMFSGELLKDFTNMTKVMGYTNEAAGKLSKITVATGTDLSDNTAQILGTAAAFNVTNKVALNEKEIVEDVAKASASVTVSLGMQPGKIAAAVVQAKKLGLELEQVEKISESLLNFESSISNELEAELLTGRSLNLEQARYLALTNDVEGVAKEIANQGITAAEFTGMNMIQQKAIAEAVGMTREELAQSLINQQALTKAGMAGKTTQEAYNELKKQNLTDDEIAKKLGDEKLAQQMKSQSVQERFNATIEKLKEIFVTLVDPLIPVLNLFGDLLSIVGLIMKPIGFVFEKMSLLGPILGGIAKFLGAAAIAAFLLTTSLSGGLAAAGILAAVGGGMALYQQYMAPAGDVYSPANGKTQISTKEGGLFELSKNDDIIAAPGISNLFGNTTQTTSPSISVNITPLVNEMQAVKAVLVQILNKDSNVYLDGAKVGKGVAMASSKIG